MSAPIESHLSYHGAADRAVEFQMVGWVLARSQAKAGDAASISGYVGNGNQTQRDHTALKAAARQGRMGAHQKA
jgi:hypothetical protein